MKTLLNHVRVNVSDIKKALKWYEEILGFENDSGWPLDNPTYYDFLSEEGATFSIMEVKGEKSHGRYNFQVDNVDELWENLKDKVEIVEPLFDTPWGTRKFTIFSVNSDQLRFIACWQNVVYEFELDTIQYILRITHESHRSKKLIEEELEWVCYLSDNGVNVCRPILSKNNKLVEEVTEKGHTFFITAFNKAKGSKINALEMWTGDIIQKCGEITGHIHSLSKQFKKQIRYTWLENGYIVSRKKYIPSHFTDVLENADILLKDIQNFNKDSNNFGMVHGDINCGNFFMDYGEIILYDFDECSQGWFIDDIAIQLFYFTYALENREERTEHFMHHFIKGYTKYNKIGKNELSRIPLLLKLRELIVFVGACRGLDINNLDNYTQMFFDKLSLK